MVKIQVNSSGKAYYTSGGKVLVATSGGITPTGSINITENGSHNVTAYATAVVNVTPDTTALEAQLDSIIAQGYTSESGDGGGGGSGEYGEILE